MIVPDGTGLNGSYKQVSEFGSPLGMITQDRRVGIRGTIGAVNTFPVDVAVQNATGTQVATYHVGVADPQEAASTVAGTVGTAAYPQLDQYGADTGAVPWTIGCRRADGTTGSLTNSQVTASSSTFPDVVGTSPAADVWAITSNKFEDVTITRIQITLKLQNADAIAYQAADVSDTASSFDEVLDSLAATQPDNLVLGSTYYRLKKGSTTRNFTWTAPGAVTGSTKASFSIRS